MARLSSDPIDILIRSDAWGTREVIRLCRPLAREQFHRSFPIGLASLHETLVHTIGAMRSWTDRLADRPSRPWLYTTRSGGKRGIDGRDYTPDELAALLDDAERDLLDVAASWRGRLDTTVSVQWPSDDGSLKHYTFTRAAVIVHVCTHGFYHRAQAMNMLRHLEIPGLSDDLPETGAIDWQAQIECPPVITPAPPRGTHSGGNS